MSLRNFIKEHKDDIDYMLVRFHNIDKSSINNNERELWILNDESMYNWARANKVNI